MEILILICLILLNGVFAMSEIALVTAKKSRLSALANRGHKSARVALALADDPTQLLSTVQIGITSIGIMNGIFGESILADPFSVWLMGQGLSEDASQITATTLVIVLVTYVSIVVGELVPKRIGQMTAERVACAMAMPMAFLAKLTKPFVLLLTSSTHFFVKFLRLGRSGDANVTEEDIQAILQEGSTSGVIEHSEHTLVKNVLRLDRRSIASLMVPRTDILYLDIHASLEDNYRRIMEAPHSRFPVCDGQMDNILGVISAKELLAKVIHGDAINLANLARPAHFVLESLSAMELLEFFRSSNTYMVFIVDEYGDLNGLVTLQDLLEALTGEFSSTEDADSYVVMRDDGSYLLDGLLSAVDLKDCLGLQQLPHEGEYETLNGMIMQMMGRIPKTGDKVSVAGWKLEIVDMDGMRIDKVLAQSVTSSADHEDDDG